MKKFSGRIIEIKLWGSFTAGKNNWTPGLIIIDNNECGYGKITLVANNDRRIKFIPRKNVSRLTARVQAPIIKPNGVLRLSEKGTKIVLSAPKEELERIKQQLAVVSPW